MEAKNIPQMDLFIELLPIYKLHHDNQNKLNVNLISSWNPKIHNTKTKAWSMANKIKPTKVHNMPTNVVLRSTNKIYFIYHLAIDPFITYS
jgi:hypothetical protein